MKKSLFLMVGWLFLALLLSPNTFSQTTEFSYQGSLKNGGTPASGNFDFEFSLFDSLSGGAQVGTTIAVNNVTITNGIFSVKLDFGNQFGGANRFLEIRVRPAGQPGITTLAPRQLINSTPYSVKSLTSDNATNAVTATNSTNAITAVTATNALQLGGITANQYVLIGDLRLSDARNPLPNSPNYIQNTNSQQASSNFNISGNGTIGGNLSVGGAFSLNIVNANTQYNLGGSRVLSNAGTNNLFAGVDAGTANTTGSNNAFFGYFAGFANSGGSRNSFFGDRAGQSNSGNDNSFFGMLAGRANTSGRFNSFFGSNAGFSTTDGRNNAFFGYQAGYSNTYGDGNAFFGTNAGRETLTGFRNSFFGTAAGFSNTTGERNVFIGDGAGIANTLGSANTFIGTEASQLVTSGFGNTVVGYRARVFGADVNFATAIGENAVVTRSYSLVLGSDVNVGIGTSSPVFKLQVIDSGNTGLRVQNDTAGGTVASFGGFGEFQIDSPGVTAGRFRVSENGVVGIGGLGSAGSTSLCRNASNQISNCSSSIRYKSNINPFRPGLSLVNRLRPVSFNWKDGGMLDVGLVAEEVAQVEPLLVTYNSKGEIEGVKYDRLNVVLINAVKEQQTQIEALEKKNESMEQQIEQQRKRIESLMNFVCALSSNADACRP